MESPNSMAFFIIIVSGALLHKFRKKLEYHIVLLTIILVSLIIITYSRSALLGIFSASFLLIILNIKNIYKKYKKETIISIFLLAITTT
jgi:hypothetical protein